MLVTVVQRVWLASQLLQKIKKQFLWLGHLFWLHIRQPEDLLTVQNPRCFVACCVIYVQFIWRMGYSWNLLEVTVCWTSFEFDYSVLHLCWRNRFESAPHWRIFLAVWLSLASQKHEWNCLKWAWLASHSLSINEKCIHMAWSSYPTA